MSIGYQIPAIAHLENGVQIKKWQKKNILAKENREQEYPLSLQNRTTESDEGICRRV